MKNPSSDYQSEASVSPTDGNRIEVESTSPITASVSPIELCESETDVTRILIEPTLVKNSSNSEKCISVKLIYEKRSKGDDYPTEKITPRIVKTGETMELTLDTTATLSLFQNLAGLYNLYAQNGIPYGSISYTQIDSCFNSILDINQIEPIVDRMIGNPEYYELVKDLLQKITRVDSIDSLKNAVRNLQSSNIAQLSESINIERLTRAISIIEDNLDNSSEEFWQSKVFKENQWVLAQLFASPCTIFQDKAYVGGKSIDNHNGNLCDFLYQNKITKNVVLIEIKTPKTAIIQGKYRHTYSFTQEMSGAINQVINYRDSLMKEYSNIRVNTSEPFSVFNPKCVVIIGNLSSLDSKQIAAFENYRNSLNNIVILSYDEILTRLKNLRSIFSSDIGVDQPDLDDKLPF